MAEPQGDDGDVDAGMQQGHGRRMPQNVRCHVLGGYGWACPGGSGGVLSEEPFDGVMAEAGAAPGREQRVGPGAAAFGEPVTEDGRGGGGERGRAFLTSLIPTLP